MIRRVQFRLLIRATMLLAKVTLFLMFWLLAKLSERL